MDGRDWVNIVVAFGSNAVSITYGYLGSNLFVIGATGGFKFPSSVGGNAVGIESVAPGLTFAFFGMYLAVSSLRKLVDGPRRYPLDRGVRSWISAEPRGRRGWHGSRRG